MEFFLLSKDSKVLWFSARQCMPFSSCLLRLICALWSNCSTLSVYHSISYRLEVLCRDLKSSLQNHIEHISIDTCAAVFWVCFVLVLWRQLELVRKTFFSYIVQNWLGPETKTGPLTRARPTRIPLSTLGGRGSEVDLMTWVHKDVVFVTSCFVLKFVETSKHRFEDLDCMERAVREVGLDCLAAWKQSPKCRKWAIVRILCADESKFMAWKKCVQGGLLEIGIDHEQKQISLWKIELAA